MNKYCKNCGSVVSYDAKFCQSCGGSDFVINNYIANQPYNNQNQYNQQNFVDQTCQPPIQQYQPKKKKTGLVIGIVASVLIVLALIGVVAEKIFQNQGYGEVNNDYSYDNSESNDSANNFEEIPDKLYYSKGTFDGSIYVNKWADIKLSLPEGFSNADLATYSAAENPNTECGAYFVADDTMGVIYICYEKLPKFPIYDEEKYLDAAMETLKSISGIAYQTPDTYSTVNIAGNSFLKAECQFDNGNGIFSNTIYVRKLDDYIIFISAAGVDAEYNDTLVGNITKAN